MDAVPGDGDVVVVAPTSRAVAPSLPALLAEGPRAVVGLAELAASRGALRDLPRGDGRPVLLLPGLANGDRSNFVLRHYLTTLGYRAEGWGLGRNRGLKAIGKDGAKLFARVERLVAEAGQPATLIGVSLGGIMARVVAQRRPDLVREVITISSPFAGPASATNVGRVFEFLSGDRLTDAHVAELLTEAARPLPVRSTAIWSRTDGLVNGFNCRPEGDPQARTIEIRSSHLWVQMRAAVVRAVAETLAGA